MEVGGIFALSAERAEWLLAKQRIVSENIANANSPGYKAKDMAPFSRAVQIAETALRTTNPMHLTDGESNYDVVQRDTQDNVGTVSGNSVNLQTELMHMAEVRQNYGLNMAVVKSFHRMYLMSLKGGA